MKDKKLTEKQMEEKKYLQGVQAIIKELETPLDERSYRAGLSVGEEAGKKAEQERTWERLPVLFCKGCTAGGDYKKCNPPCPTFKEIEKLIKNSEVKG